LCKNLPLENSEFYGAGLYEAARFAECQTLIYKALILKITATDQGGNKNDDEARGVTLSAAYAGGMQCSTRCSLCKKRSRAK
jgi:hypothetical protein